MSDEVREAYDTWAPTYDSQDNPTRDLDGELLRALAWPWPELDLLEIGCGTGKNTTWLAPRCRRLVGTDISPGMLARCRQGAPGAALLRLDLAAPWPFPDATFDAVLADLVLEHVEDLDHVAAEAARVLRPGGRFRLAELHPWRQHHGGGAHYLKDGLPVQTPTVTHTTEQCVSAGLGAGLRLKSLAEPRGRGDADDRPPRLLVLEFRRQG